MCESLPCAQAVKCGQDNVPDLHNFPGLTRSLRASSEGKENICCVRLAWQAPVGCGLPVAASSHVLIERGSLKEQQHQLSDARGPDAYSVPASSCQQGAVQAVQCRHHG